MINSRVVAQAGVAVVALWAAAASGSEEAQLVDEAESGEAVEEGPGDAAAATETGSDETPEQLAFAVNDVIELGDSRLTVNGVQDPVPPVSEFDAPEPGNRWIGLDVTVENVGDTPMTFSSDLSFELQDSESFTYDTAWTGVEPQAPGGEIAPGSQKRGTVIFEVPETASGFKLQYEGELFDSGSVTVELG